MEVITQVPDMIPDESETSSYGSSPGLPEASFMGTYSDALLAGPTDKNCLPHDIMSNSMNSYLARRKALPFPVVPSHKRKVRVPSAPNAKAVWFLKQVDASFRGTPGANIGPHLFLPTDVWHMPQLPERLVRLLQERADVLVEVAHARTKGVDNKKVKKLTKTLEQVYKAPLLKSQLSLNLTQKLHGMNLSAVEDDGTELQRKHSTSSNGSSSSTGHKITPPIITRSNTSPTSRSFSVPSMFSGAPSVNRLRKKSSSMSISEPLGVQANRAPSQLFPRRGVLPTFPETVTLPDSAEASLYTLLGEKQASSSAILQRYAQSVSQLVREMEQEGYSGDAAGRYVKFVVEVVTPHVIDDILTLHQIHMQLLLQTLF